MSDDEHVSELLGRPVQALWTIQYVIDEICAVILDLQRRVEELEDD